MPPAVERFIPSALPSQEFVYLAGPILGCTEGEANDWRVTVDKLLKPHNIIGISPLRCEPIRGPRYTMESPDPKFGTARAISSKNLFDVHRCRMGIFYIPKPRTEYEEAVQRYEAWRSAYEAANLKAFDAFVAGMDAAKRHSFGTVGELFWMNALEKPTILVSDDPFIQTHPVIDAASNWKLATLEDACDVVLGLLGGYAGGKNV
jgi:nucleoside 2-deoxyribosyltransferase